MRNHAAALALALMLISAGACVAPTKHHALRAPATPSTLTDVREVCYVAVDKLLAQCETKECGRLLVATLVDINDVGRTSMFGRQISEFHASRLSQRSVDVIHATVRQDHMIIRENGQFLLSRDIQNLAADYNAKFALVGTYGVVSEEVTVSLRLVSTVDDSTVAAVDYELPHSKSVVDMLSTYRYSTY
jgi:TolB-like protein